MSHAALLCLASAAAAAHALHAYPPVGTRVSMQPFNDAARGLRHCDYVCSASALEPGNEDFEFDVAAAKNGNTAPGYVSFTSANFPDHLLSPTSTGKVGVNVNPDVNDGTWQLVPVGANWTLVSQSNTFAGMVLSLARTVTNPCGDGPDVVLAAPGAGGMDAQTWVVGAPPPPPPPPPSAFTIAAGTATSTLPDSVRGCHHDEGFMHAPQSFLSQMVYGEAFEPTNGMRGGGAS